MFGLRTRRQTLLLVDRFTLGIRKSIQGIKDQTGIDEHIADGQRGLDVVVCLIAAG
jgi:hypothetical protein